MNWINKLFGRGRKKEAGEVVIEGGLELLAKLKGTAGLSKSQMMEKYTKSLYVFACVSKIAEKIASVPLELYRVQNSRGDMKEIQAHPLLDLLYRPNPFQTKSEFWELSMINLKITGEAFWYKVRNTRGAVVELWNLRPDLMRAVPDPVTFVKEYRLRKADGTDEVFAPEDIIHFKSPDPTNPLMGLSPLAPASRRVETEEFATDYQRDFFLNSARPDAVIKSPDANLDQDQKDDIREGWEKKHKGVGKSSKIAILEGGLDYQVISLSQREMDYIESMKFTRDDILVAYKIPKVILSIVEDVNRANAETGMAIFLSETIKPEVDRFMEKVNEQMTYPDFGDDLYVEPEDPTPANRELELKEYETGIKNGYLLINEVRAKEGLAPIAGGWTLYMPIVNVPAGGLAGQPQKMGGASRESAYDGGAPQEKAKRFDFRGRYWLLKKFELHEAMLGAAAKAMIMASKPKKIMTLNGKKAFVPMIKDDEVKKAYAEMILKRIDAGVPSFKAEIAKFAEGQKGRVLEIMAKVKDKKAKATAEEALAKIGVQLGGPESDILATISMPQIEALLTLAAKDALDMTAPAVEFQTTKRIRSFIEKRAKELAESVNNTTLEGLQKTLSEGIAAKEGIAELKARVDEAYAEFPAWRTELIARTEATAANNKGTLEGFKQSDVANAKQWINAGDARVREEHQDGIGVGDEIVGLDEEFSNGLKFPEEPNCRCVIGPAFLEQ